MSRAAAAARRREEASVVLVFPADQGRRRTALQQINDCARDLVALALAEGSNDRQFFVSFGVEHKDKSVKQRGFFHAAVLPQIAEQASVDGARFEAVVWKEFFRRQYLPDTWISLRLPGAKRARPHRVRSSTEDLNVKSYSLHIDRVIAHAASELGVEFMFRADERQAVRWTEADDKKTGKAKSKAPPKPQPTTKETP